MCELICFDFPGLARLVMFSEILTQGDYASSIVDLYSAQDSLLRPSGTCLEHVQAWSCSQHALPFQILSSLSCVRLRASCSCATMAQPMGHSSSSSGLVHSGVLTNSCPATLRW